jgi:1-acyl-sn-glycerol-3-phosphate acyltransferase
MDSGPLVNPEAEIPTISPWLWRPFGHVVRFYLRRSFHAIRLSPSGWRPVADGASTVIFLNHPSWWDPLVAIFLAQQLMPEHQHYGPMDAEALARYRLFQHLGLFGVTPGTRPGAAMFLRVSQAILRQPRSVLWMTPEGRFTDPRQRPAQLQPGLAALARRVDGVALIPLAIEYVFWEERYPEILLQFGEAISLSSGQVWKRDAYTAHLAQQLEMTQDALARAAQRRDPTAFETVLRGRVGVGGIYDAWRALRAYWRGEGQSFRRAHGAKNR